MSPPTAIDRGAPVISHHEIDIGAPLAVVWRRHIDVNAWPTWQTDITAARIDGTLRQGASFDWTSYGFSVTSTVYDVADRSRILWGVTADGITGIHEWLFEETPAGRTWSPASRLPAIRSPPIPPTCKPCSTLPSRPGCNTSTRPPNQPRDRRADSDA